MKKIFYLAGLFLTTLLMSACNNAGVSAKIDPKAFENKEEVQKIYDAILKCMGDQASKADEITFNIDNPADKGKEGDAYLYIIADMQDPKNPKQLIRQMFHGELGYWANTQEVTVDLRGSDEDKANFRLEDELFDFTAKVNVETLNKIIQESYNKSNVEPEKYTYVYVERVQIDKEGYRIDVKNKLAANDQVISEYYTFDFDGNSVK
jgi:hypothetical protein